MGAKNELHTLSHLPGLLCLSPPPLTPSSAQGLLLPLCSRVTLTVLSGTTQMEDRMKGKCLGMSPLGMSPNDSIWEQH